MILLSASASFYRVNREVKEVHGMEPCLLLLIRVCVLMTNVFFFFGDALILYYCVDLIRVTTVLTFSKREHRSSTRDPASCPWYIGEISLCNDKRKQEKNYLQFRVFDKSCTIRRTRPLLCAVPVHLNHM